MVAKSTLNAQLDRLRMHFWLFGRAEVKELHNILNPDEEIAHCAHGYYNGGSGLIVATNERLLLIDKRPFYLNLEDMQYHRIRNINFDQRFLQGVLHIKYGSKALTFRSISDARLRQMEHYISQQMEIAQVRFASVLQSADEVSTDRHKPYLNAAWRPHHATLLPRQLRRRPSKFYSTRNSD